MGQPRETISFLSDYGWADEFVGVVHSVIRRIAPGSTVIDICHEVPPHDVRSGSLTLVRAVQYLVPGVILAVVDPGVATARRAIAVEAGDDAAATFVGPDNGLLASAVAMLGGAARAVELTEDGFHLPAPGPTFAGRDVFAPVAAHLCQGVDLSELGPALDPLSLLPGLLPLPHKEGDVLSAEVLWVDRFGNIQLNVASDEVDDMGDRVLVGWAGTTRTAVRAGAYADIASGQIGLVVDSYGMIAIAVDQSSAAAELGLAPGDSVSLRATG
jgi:S-adenosyl-L-methionine hydrolase (adenosine-forming)